MLRSVEVFHYGNVVVVNDHKRNRLQTFAYDSEQMAADVAAVVLAAADDEAGEQ